MYQSGFTLITEENPLDLSKIKQVVDLMKKSGLSEFEIQDQEFKLRIKRDVAGQGLVHNVAPSAAPATPAPAPVAPPAPTPAAPAPAAPAAADPGVKIITSPMVGTFYAAPSPDNPPFVTVGSPVKPDSVVCIVEAMKVMNEIQSELTGTVVECLVASGTSVEFGQPLFRVKVS
jgi:acetyl-CoA carboxylase biotin carboxyl carrier protein